MISRSAMLIALLLAACGPTSRAPAALPTASLRLSAPAPAPTLPAASPSSNSAPAASPLPAASPATPLEQYRVWMAAAREQYPYPEPIEDMWALMICESSGQPDVVAGENYGLFQYNAATWAGQWNPYREQAILDPHAQIFATAKAWHDGNQSWWGCY